MGLNRITREQNVSTIRILPYSFCDEPQISKLKHEIYTLQFLFDNSVPPFDMQNVISYSIERKTKDNVANKDYKNVSNKAFVLFRHGHI